MVLNLSYSEAQEEIFFTSASAKYRIFPKGRRLGVTRGAASAFIEYMLQGKQCLWGDTVHGNIERYVERYFKPILKANNIPYSWSSAKKVMKVGAGFTDFRSADKPENWEGFGYHVIFLNEAGIILRDPYLFENAVLPMMLDFRESTLIASGAPKGKIGKGGTEAKFFSLWKKAASGAPNYYGRRFTTYDNPWLSPEDIDELKDQISPVAHAQEIGGEFTDGGGQLFEGLRYYDVLAPRGFTIIGLDLAFGEDRRHDYSAATVWNTIADLWQLRYVERWKKEIHETLDMIDRILKQYPGVILVEANGAQKITYDMLKKKFPRVIPVNRTRDKYTESQPFALAWSSGRVELPKSAPWLNAYTTELFAFTGSVANETDDQLDASVNAFKFGDRTQSKTESKQRRSDVSGARRER